MYRPTRKQRGSRARRTGLTRSGEHALRGIDREPLPEDRGERNVEVAKRAWLKAAWSDQRITANKKNAARKRAAFEFATEQHLTRDHGVTIDRKTERWGGYAHTDVYIDGEKILNLTRYHDTFHEEEDA